MSPPFFLKSGIIPGRSHLFYGKNCQDAVRSLSLRHHESDYQIGFVCDGCSSGKYSEVGANLGISYLINKTEILVRAGVPLYVIPTYLYRDTLEYLNKLIYNEDEDFRSQFIQDYLLFTVVGFISGPEITVVLNAGDGLIAVNDEITQKDCHNEPEYLAYHLVDESRLLPDHRILRQEFETVLLDSQGVNRLAIGSDGWFDHPNLLSEVWDKNHPNSLQRQLNVWSTKDHFFSDDTSLVVLESISE